MKEIPRGEQPDPSALLARGGSNLQDLFIVVVLLCARGWLSLLTAVDRRSGYWSVTSTESTRSDVIALLFRMSFSKITRSLLVIGCVLSALCVLLAHSQPASPASSNKDSTSLQHPPDPESLPPDTFRKLAQALYHRGDKEENRLQRKFFYNSSVTCNDGSVAGYYIRRNYQSKKWIVFLEGML